METLVLNQRDRKIIRKQFHPTLFNIITSFVFGLVIIFVLPHTDLILLKGLTLKNIIILQFILLVFLVLILTYYFLIKTKIFRNELKENLKKVVPQLLINKKTTPKRNYIIYTPENNKEDFIFKLEFENIKIEVDRNIYDTYDIGKVYNLYFTPESKIFLSFHENY